MLTFCPFCTTVNHKISKNIHSINKAAVTAVEATHATA
jgi:hypothetical protein